MVELSVDLDALDGLAGLLGQIGERLDRAQRDLEGDEHVLGDEAVSDALQRFEHRWRDGRDTLRQEGDALRSMLVESARCYRETDAKLASGWTTQAVPRRGLS